MKMISLNTNARAEFVKIANDVARQLPHKQVSDYDYSAVFIINVSPINRFVQIIVITVIHWCLLFFSIFFRHSEAKCKYENLRYLASIMVVLSLSDHNHLLNWL